MKKASGSFLKISVYRRRFTGTVCSIVVIAAICFGFAVCFFTAIWAGGRQQTVNDRFMTLEQQKQARSERLEGYIGGLYASSSLMEDAKALFESADGQEYTNRRRSNSTGSSAQIGWLPGDMRKLFTDRQLTVTGVLLRSESGGKAIWLDRTSGDMQVSYGIKSDDQLHAIPGFGDVSMGTYEIRSPDSLLENLGSLEFYGNCADIYAGPDADYAWAVVSSSHMVFSSGLEQERQWLLKAAEYGAVQGCFLWEGRLPVFYYGLWNASGDLEYVSVVDVLSLWQANRQALLILAGLVLMLAAGAAAVVFVNMGKEARFLSHIMDMLKVMEHGSFTEVGAMALKQGGPPNEYVMIADALSDVSVKLDGYIRKEYLLKLKQQETAMRALRHQINPHFLYNTLESIRARALVLKDRETAEAIEGLGRLYRTLVHYPEVISLQKETELLEMYLKLMSLRFADTFVYRVDIEEETKNVETIAFWLQPLAENFFNHGIDRDSEFNLLMLEAVKKENGILVTMSDNGLGIPKDRLLEIKKNMVEGGDDPGADIGLRNVYMRLNYFYGEAFTMNIENQKAGGLKIDIFLPTLPGKE